MDGLIRGYKQHLTVPHPGWQRTDPLDRGLVGEWRFDPVTGLMVPDYSGYGADGTFQGDTEFQISKIGPVAYFDGVDDYITVPDRPHLRLGGDFSLEVGFLTPITLNAQNDWCALIIRFMAAPSDHNYFIVVGNGEFLRAGYNNTLGNEQKVDTVGYTPTLNEPQHIVLSAVSAASVTIYVNGAYNNTAAAVGIPNLHAGDLYFGSQAGHQDFQGSFYLARIYNRALTASEVQARYELCLKRTNPMTHTWMIPWGMVTAVPRIPRPPAAYNTLAIY